LRICGKIAVILKILRIQDTSKGRLLSLLQNEPPGLFSIAEYKRAPRPDRVFECETEKQFLQLANDFHVLGVLQKCIISQQICV
jgi:hypothetical protein